jgi:hypothetical protein
VKHRVVTTIEVPMVRHTGVICVCGEVFILDVGDYATYTAQLALLRGHISGQVEESHDLLGHDITRESVLV